MTTIAPTLPPPLSAPPSVTTLRELLDGLQQPMQRGVPSPPSPSVGAPAVRATGVDRREVLDLTVPEQPVANGHEAVVASMWGDTEPPDGVPAPSDVPDPVTSTAFLTWSAGRVHHPRTTAVAVAAVAAAAGALGALAVVGELGLP